MANSNNDSRRMIKRLHGLARRHWEDGRNCHCPFASHYACARAAAEKVGVPSDLFERWYSSCFKEVVVLSYY